MISPWTDQEGNKLQRPNLGSVQLSPHEPQYTSKLVALILQGSQETNYPRQQWSPRGNKNVELSIVFSDQRTGGSPTCPEPENRVCDQDNGSQGSSVSSELQVPVSGGIVVQEQETIWWSPSGVFWSQNIKARTYPVEFCTRIIWGRGKPQCCQSIDCCFVCEFIVI